jgi:hypothetical protein
MTLLLAIKLGANQDTPIAAAGGRVLGGPDIEVRTLVRRAFEAFGKRFRVRIHTAGGAEKVAPRARATIVSSDIFADDYCGDHR